MANDDIAFRRAIVAAPDDMLPRLIYADYLDGRGDPYGEFVRVQLELAKYPPALWVRDYTCGGSPGANFEPFDRADVPEVGSLVDLYCPRVWGNRPGYGFGTVGRTLAPAALGANAVEWMLEKPEWEPRVALRRQEEKLFNHRWIDLTAPPAWPDSSIRNWEYGVARPLPWGGELVWGKSVEMTGAPDGSLVSDAIEGGGIIHHTVGTAFREVARVIFRRGFVEEVRGRAEDLAPDLADVFDVNPVRRLVLTGRGPALAEGLWISTSYEEADNKAVLVRYLYKFAGNRSFGVRVVKMESWNTATRLPVGQTRTSRDPGSWAVAMTLTGSPFWHPDPRIDRASREIAQSRGILT